MGMRASGSKDAAKVLKSITDGSPSLPTRYLNSINRVEEGVLSPEEALAMLIDNNLSKKQYNGIRNVALKVNSQMYPSYNRVLEAKKQCYPSDESDITISETHAEIKLQPLLYLTTQRLLLANMDIFDRDELSGVSNFSLTVKWGLDGTSSSEFKQKFANDDGTATDAYIFFTSLVPVQLIVVIDGKEEEKIVLWQNPRPSSTRFCRPIKIEFLKETAESTRTEVDHIKDQIEKLEPFVTVVNGKVFTVNFVMMLTMIDGKVCNALTNTSSTQRCYICNATSKDFNNVDEVVKRAVTVDNLQYGISSLHAWIRFFECCLHVSYRLENKKWQARSEAEKDSVKKTKANIQLGFRQQLGLRVDQPKHGYGNTNDGNTARRFFEHSDISASITGFDIDLIERFHTILQILSCGLEVNMDKFQVYCIQTARQFVSLYPWFPMPPTVHKVLIHGSEIMSSLLLPIGQLSEEAQESCNKFLKKFRVDHARQSSRENNIEDVLKRLLIMSDPLISCHRELPRKKGRALSSEASALLKETVENQCTENEESSDDSDGE